MNSNIYLVAGGSWDNFPKILNLIVEDSGLIKPTVAYVGVANDDSAWFLTSARDQLVAAGCGKVVKLDLTDKKKTQAALEDCQMVFISGGDVQKGMKVLNDSGAAELLQSTFYQGKYFIGVSAGAIMLCKQWVAWHNARDSSAYLFDCLGFARIYCDTHDEPAWQEIKALLRLSPNAVEGIGLNSGSAVKVVGTKYEVIAGKVTVVSKADK